MGRLEVETLYTTKEIEAATGIKASVLNTRRKKLGIPTNPDGYSMAEVKKMIKRPSRSRAKFSQRKADALKRMLENDGAI